MKAIILAAGRGSRMKEMTETMPKCLVSFQGRPLLEWQLNAIRKAGINEIAIVTGYKNTLLQKYHLVEFHNPDWETTNMVTSLTCADQWLSAEPCIISYADIFYTDNAISLLMNTSDLLAITYDPNWKSLWQSRFEDPLIDAETFRIDSNGYLLEIGQKAKTIEEIEGQYMGLLRLTPQSWSVIKTMRTRLSSVEQDTMHMTGTLQMLIEKKLLSIQTIPYGGVWGEIDSQADWNYYNENFIV